MEKKRQRGRRKTPVIVWGDDDGYSVRPIMEILKARGYEVKYAASGSEVIDAVYTCNGNVDLVLLDVMMNPGKKLTVRDTFYGERL